MTRTDELRSIGLIRIADIAIILNIDADRVKERIVSIGIAPFERWWYNEYQLDLIKNNFTNK